VGCRALLEFGRTKLSTKKVGNKIVMGGEAVQKSWLFFFQNELFFRISLIVITRRNSRQIKTSFLGNLTIERSNKKSGVHCKKSDFSWGMSDKILNPYLTVQSKKDTLLKNFTF
jgi:hypothetical protein